LPGWRLPSPYDTHSEARWIVTSVVAWVGVDSRGPASVYIATDSRISWPPSKEAWDQGRKTFASRRFPDVAGYWGDVLFPTVTLSQFFEQLDLGVAATAQSNSKTRAEALERSLRLSLKAMPARQRRSFTVVHAARDDDEMSSRFFLRSLSWSPSGGWTKRTARIPKVSSAVEFGGTGMVATKLQLERWERSSSAGTSRSVFSAFVEGLLAGDDPLSGGAPQLVGIYRKGSGRAFGTVIDKHRYLYGAPVTAKRLIREIEWRNELFERVSGTTRKRVPDAQSHARPSR
jgi:hypothetical protein